MINEQNHLSRSSVRAYLDKTLSDNKKAEIEEHLRNCPECAAMRALTVQLRNITANVEVKEPPTNLIQKVIKAATKKLEQKNSTHQKILPQIADSRLFPSVEGMRGSMQNRHMLYADETLMVNIENKRTDKDHELHTMRGQVSVSDSDEQELTGIEVQIFNDDGLVRRCLTDDIGQFRISGLPTDRYNLYIEQLFQHTIVVEGVELL